MVVKELYFPFLTAVLHSIFSYSPLLCFRGVQCELLNNLSGFDHPYDGGKLKDYFQGYFSIPVKRGNEMSEVQNHSE